MNLPALFRVDRGIYSPRGQGKRGGDVKLDLDSQVRYQLHIPELIKSPRGDRRSDPASKALAL